MRHSFPVDVCVCALVRVSKYFFFNTPRKDCAKKPGFAELNRLATENKPNVFIAFVLGVLVCR